MDKNEIARHLAVLGRREKRLMNKLVLVHEERCALLTGAAQEPAAGLDPDVVAFTVAPKDED